MPRKEITFTQVIQALLDQTKPFSPVYLHSFSDLSPANLADLTKIWLEINERRRVSLMEDLEDLNDSDTLVDFSDLSRFALEDPLPPVRAAALRLLWEVKEPRVIPKLLLMLEKDPDEVVRATAATALGQYVYLGELEEIAPAALSRIEDALLKKVSGGDSPLVRRRALESLGFSSRHEVLPLIRKYMASGENDWIASAVYAIGHSADQQWAPEVVELITSPEPDIQLEAVRAAGSLEITNARQPLLDLLEDAEELDEEVRLAAVWSLSQIGGESVREMLEKLYDACEDDNEADLIDQALENLEFIDGSMGLDLLAIPPVNEDDLDQVIEPGEDEDNGEKDPSGKTSPQKPRRSRH